MEKQTFLDQLNELVAAENPLKVSRDVSELKQKFEDFLLEEERLVQVAQLEAGEAPVGIQEVDPLKESFFETYRSFQEKRKAASDEKKETQATNLGQKKALLKRMSDIIQNEENIGAAFGAHKEISEAWKQIGDIPRTSRDEIQAEYSRLNEQFFYNMKIYKELKEHDLHRNEQKKRDLIEKLKELHAQDNIKELESQLKLLQNAWEDIGPVADEVWEELKPAYWTEVRSCYTKINAHYDKRREEQAKIIESKKTFLEEHKNFNEGNEELKSAKDWDQKTKTILDLQKQWKEMGVGPRKESDALYKEFRVICDQFFSDKKAFFEVLDERNQGLAEKKKALIEKAKELSTSTEWRDTAEQLKRLQGQWKKIGHAGQRYEQKLWKQFRAACDAFFNAREAHYAEMDKQYEGNLKEKEALIEEIKNFKPESDAKASLAKLKDFSQRFAAAGMVPKKDKDRVYSEYKTALDKHYADLKLEGAQKEKIMFEAKIETLKANPNSRKLFQKERGDIRRKIDKIKQEIQQLENNLGFFGRSKGAEKMMAQYQKQIDQKKAEIDGLKRQLKLLPNE